MRRLVQHSLLALPGLQTQTLLTMDSGASTSGQQQSQEQQQQQGAAAAAAGGPSTTPKKLPRPHRCNDRVEDLIQVCCGAAGGGQVQLRASSSMHPCCCARCAAACRWLRLKAPSSCGSASCTPFSDHPAYTLSLFRGDLQALYSLEYKAKINPAWTQLMACLRSEPG